MGRIMLVGVLALVAASAPRASGAERAGRVEAPGEFSYAPPTGWRVVEIPGLKYPVAVGTAVNRFAPNINVVGESFGGSMQEDVRRSREALRKALPEFKSLGQGAFATKSGLKGAKLVIRARQQGRLIRQMIFFLPGKAATKYVVTFSALAEEGGKYDARIDAAVRTFALR